MPRPAFPAMPTHPTIDDRPWQRLDFSTRLECLRCRRHVRRSRAAAAVSFNSPLGACPTCEGFGNVVDLDMDLVVPDPAKSIREGAIAPWNTPAYEHELEELLALAGDYQHAGRCAVPRADATSSCG